MQNSNSTGHKNNNRKPVFCTSNKNEQERERERRNTEHKQQIELCLHLIRSCVVCDTTQRIDYESNDVKSKYIERRKQNESPANHQHHEYLTAKRFANKWNISKLEPEMIAFKRNQCMQYMQ